MTTRKHTIHVTRDLTLFAVGLAGIIFETLHDHSGERPVLLGLFAGMVGLPVFLRLDGKAVAYHKAPDNE